MTQFSPWVSVVVPCAGGLEDLPDLMDSLLRQEPGFEWELILVDNGLADGPRALLELQSRRFVQSRIAEEPIKGIGPARNRGVLVATGTIIVFVDADDIVSDRWLSGLVSHVAPGKISAGYLDTVTLNPGWLADTRGHSRVGELYLCEGIYPVAPGGNMAITRSDFDLLSGFDDDGRSLEDFWLCLRAWHCCIAVCAAGADSTIYYRLRGSPSKLYQQGFRYGEARAAIYRAMFDEGLVSRFSISGWKSWLHLLSCLPRAIVSKEQRAVVAWVAGNRWGRVRGSLQHHVIYV